MGQTSGSQDVVASYRTALRRVVQWVPNARPVMTAAAPLEHLPAGGEPPHLIDAAVAEDATPLARPVPGFPQGAFAGFLDGVQQSRMLAWVGAAPIVYGLVAAAIRERVARRLVTWEGPVIERRIYAPFAYVSREALEQALPGAELVDTAPPELDGTLPLRHPTLLLERARLAVSHDREAIERRLAESWCTVRRDPILIDGPIGASDVLARADYAVGAVKNHRTLYVKDAALDAVLALERGERSRVLRVAARERAAVHSWYLRLRDPKGHDAHWGLVRIETPISTDDVTARADEISRWVLAESTPLSLPDARWDKMVYGIRNCEEFLRAVGAPA